MKIKPNKDADRQLKLIELSARQIYVVYQRIGGIQVNSEQLLRDRNHILRTIEETEYDHDKALLFVEEHDNARSKAEKDAEETGNSIIRRAKELDSEFFSRLDSLCGTQQVVLKQRQLKLIQSSLTSVHWNYDLGKIAEDILDAIDNSQDYVVPVDKNE